MGDCNANSDQRLALGRAGTKRTDVVDGSNESLYHADEELHPLVRTFSLSQTIFTNLEVLSHTKFDLS